MPSSALLKYAALSVFVVQNSGVYLLMRYSKVAPRSHGGADYNSAVAVAMQEACKLPLCVLLYMIECGGPRAMATALVADIASNGREWVQLALPAFLYTLQNNALYLGLTYLEAAIAQVTYQGKIFTTAIFSICLLGRRLNCCQWLALVLLVVGMLLVQGVPARLYTSQRRIDSTAEVRSLGPGRHLQLNLGASRSLVSRLWLELGTLLEAHAEDQRFIIGVGAILVACVCSSFAGVYFEMMLKRSSSSLWLRNIQLDLFSSAIAVGSVCLHEDPLVRAEGWLHGFGVVTWTMKAVLA